MKRKKNVYMFDAVSGLGLLVFFGTPVVLVVVIAALVIFTVKKIRQIAEEKKWEREHETDFEKNEK